MPAPITSEYSRLDVCMRCGFKAFYATLIFFSLHWAIVMYINSSFLEQFFDAQTVSMFYIIGSLLTLLAYFTTSAILSRIGNITFITLLTLAEFLVLIGMAFVTIPAVLGVMFIIHLAVTPLILFSLDTLMEGLVGNNEASTGGKRGIFLTIGGLALALSTLGMGFLVGHDVPNFSRAYIVSALFLIPFLLLLIRNFSKYIDPIYPLFRAMCDVQSFWHQKDIRNVFFAHFLLQFFFAWMVIYTPTYLATELGYNWEQIGSILFIALTAYVLLEYMIGYLADTYFGEKEMMALGFVIMAISTSCFIFLDNSSILNWMIVMFMTRVGAALVETTTESYFFKHTQGKDAGIVGIFRIAQPLGYILGPVVGGILLFFFPFSFIFVILGLIMISGLFFAMALHDTK